ncbi:type II secretion system F family protein [Aurantimonas sp. Leaf443]|uniref:type II secretion system F family protein n=1 Tax=Aurantimonas sp. Leaf443 TaxID=1736378 RepID=UPI0006F54791|nr:type II secretion system F family protein [Aurantimonas sp. Leaf443]KQT83062.1 type II secretion system protein [Aurantimonas sp. Leaf443]
MSDFFHAIGVSPSFVLSLVIGLAVFASLTAVALPLVTGNRLKGRMRAVAIEREEVRLRERARMSAERERGRSSAQLRQAEKGFAAAVVAKLNLKDALVDEKTVASLRVAGYRGQAPLNAFLAARAILPLGFGLFAVVYVFGLGLLSDYPTWMRLFACLLAAYLGFYMPNIYISNKAKKRQLSIIRAWPDALDLLLICVEAGNSIEAAFRRVAEEIGIQSIPLAEELVLVCAELSYLPERKVAYDNLAARTGLEGVKAVTTALIQAERYGTPLGSALRVLAQENRDNRMMIAEKKAAALPPKLTVPMIVFFLPVLFAVIIGPAAIKLMGSQ